MTPMTTPIYESHANDTNNYSGGRIRVSRVRSASERYSGALFGWAHSGAPIRLQRRGLRYSNAGFTLVEMLVYVAILTIILALVVGLMWNLIRSYTRYRVEREISTNVREAMNYMIREIKSAQGVYASTSVFTSHPGQLSLETRVSVPADETTTFIDFYIDNGQLLIKREGQDPFVITSDRVSVSNLVFTNFTNPTIGELVRLDLTIEHRENTSRFEFQAQQSLTSSAALRGQY